MSIKKIALAVTIFAVAIHADPKGDAVAKRYFDLKTAKDSRSTATMIVISKKGSKRVRKLTMTSKDTKEGTYAYTEFLEPADVKGTKFLVTPTASGDDEQRLYLPALKKVRRISSSAKTGKFVGSDFTYYDMEDRDFGDATYKFIKEGTVNGAPCDIIEMVSKDQTTPYSKAVGYFKKSDGFAYKMELYNRKTKKLEKTMVVVESKVIDGVIVPTKIVMDNHKGGTKTVLAVTNIKLNTGVDSSIFSIKNLEK